MEGDLVEKISFIIPCYGSEKTIIPVIEEIIDTVNKLKYEYEIIAVNDCSPDGVWNILLNIAKENSCVKPVSLAKNMNRPGAVMAGICLASGDILVIMDDDGQCPMDKLDELISPLFNGYDVSIAGYPERKQSAFKDFGTFVNKKMTEWVIDRPKNLQFTNFMAIKKFIASELVKYDNPYPYLSGLILRTTSNIINVPMEERNRIAGTTTFTFRKMLSLWINGFTAFSVKPLRLSSFIGVIAALIGFVFGIVTIIRKLVVPDISVGWSSIISVMLFIGGLIMLMLGMIGEYLGRIYISINNSPQYVIKEKINFDDR
ncbi:MAG: glycosyltransferase [Eubacterium sp.]|nr:glycosyltransferase [Eubacterium sp.]